MVQLEKSSKTSTLVVVYVHTDNSLQLQLPSKILLSLLQFLSFPNMRFLLVSDFRADGL